MEFSVLSRNHPAEGGREETCGEADGRAGEVEQPQPSELSLALRIQDN